jgi:(2Fe-2S) ferredoxin
LGASIVIYPEGIWYTKVTLKDVDDIFKTSVLGNKTMERLSSTQ